MIQESSSSIQGEVMGNDRCIHLDTMFSKVKPRISSGRVHQYESLEICNNHRHLCELQVPPCVLHM